MTKNTDIYDDEKHKIQGIEKRLFESLRTALTNEKNYGLALFVEKRYCNCLWGYLLPHKCLNTLLGKRCD